MMGQFIRYGRRRLLVVIVIGLMTLRKMDEGLLLFQKMCGHHDKYQLKLIIIGCQSLMVLGPASSLTKVKRDGVSMNEVAWNVFNVFHPPDETASNSKSARISADVHRKAMEQSQSGNTHPDMNNIFLDVAHEESKKNRMFGLGCMATSSCGQSSEVSSQANRSLEELTQKIKEELREELKEEMRANMETFCAQFIANYSPPPPE